MGEAVAGHLEGGVPLALGGAGALDERGLFVAGAGSITDLRVADSVYAIVTGRTQAQVTNVTATRCTAAVLVDGAVDFAARLGEAPTDVYAGVKRDLRGAAAERAREALDEGHRVLVTSWISPAGRTGRAAALSRVRGS